MRKKLLCIMGLWASAAYTHPFHTLIDTFPVQTTMLDIQALQKLPLKADEHIWMRALGPWPQPLAIVNPVEEPDVWQARLGVPFAQIQAMASHQTLSAWQMVDADSAKKAFAHLDSQKFEKLDEHRKHLSQNWENPDRVWQPGMQTVVIELLDNKLLLSDLEPRDPSLAAMPVQSRDALDAALQHLPQDALLLQAYFFDARDMSLSDAVMMDAVFDLNNTLQDAKDAKAKVEEKLAAAGKGVPPYAAAMLADVQVGDYPLLVLALAYPSCNDAEKAAEILPKRWQQWLDERDVGKMVESATIESVPVESRCVVLLQAREKEAGIGIPKVIRFAINQTMHRKFIPALVSQD